MQNSIQKDPGGPRGFWRKALGVTLLVWSVGLVSCQSLFTL